VVRDSVGELKVGRNLPGRGAWLCKGSKGCAEAALRKGAFLRALRAESDKEAGERLALELRHFDYDPPEGESP
jgi:predicted RNA-binding protein YlxR (DUF448 family)